MVNHKVKRRNRRNKGRAKAADTLEPKRYVARSVGLLTPLAQMASHRRRDVT
jgi:hypothetical protein